MTTPFIVGNWKMNTSLEEAVALAGAVAQAASHADPAVEVGICPPFPWLVPVREAIQGRTLRLGAQDCAATDNGAFTGDVSASMLAPVCDLVLVGHSERRSIHGETDDIVRQKAARAIAAGLQVILCVGESKEERDAGNAEAVVSRQLQVALEGLDASAAGSLTIAYEPVWAIGTGVAATEQDASAMARFIDGLLADRFGGQADSIRFLYGGSANAGNAAAFLGAEGVDGLLVGGASLKPDEFAAMIAAAGGAG
jgi:triosephosphate isomerase